MKNIFKLAAVAVSMALVTSLVACSSGDDDVVDATTPKYLLTAQIKQYVDSIKYDQNVSDGKIDEKKNEIKSFKDAHEAVMKIIGDCEDCLAAYFEQLKGDSDSNVNIDITDPFTLDAIEDAKDELAYLKSYGREEEYHKVYVYKPAIEKALDAVSKDDEDSTRKNVDNIGSPDGKTIIDGKLNNSQTASMKAYIDAAAALKSVLKDADKKTCKDSIDEADAKITAFNNAVEKKTVSDTVIEAVIKAVDDMHDDIQTNVVDKIVEKSKN